MFTPTMSSLTTTARSRLQSPTQLSETVAVRVGVTIGGVAVRVAEGVVIPVDVTVGVGVIPGGVKSNGTQRPLKAPFSIQQRSSVVSQRRLQHRESNGSHTLD